MPKPPPASPLLRIRRDGSWTLRTGNLPKLRHKLGDGVLNCFIRGFLHADRLDALVSFNNLSVQHLGSQQSQLRRNHLVFLLYLVGTMKELAECLNALRAALSRSHLLDTEEWDRLLGGWDARWRKDPVVTRVRNTMAFHIDHNIIDVGLDALPKDEPIEIYRGLDPTLVPDGSFPLGQAALLGSLGLSEPELAAFFSRPIQDFGVPLALMTLLSSTLRRAGLPPRVQTTGAV